MKTISFPHLGDYYYPIKYLLEKLTNLNVVPSPPITKKTIELGEKNSPTNACVPFKYNLGNFIESEVIKSSGKYYRVQATNKCITEFTEV